MKTSVYILVHNNAELLARCLQNLWKYKNGNEEIFVINNGSDEAMAVSYLQWIEKHKDVKVINFDKNLCFAKAHNRAIAETKPQGDIVLLNSDCYVFKGWLDHFEKFKAEHPQAGVIGALLYKYLKNNVQHSGVVFGEDRVACHRLYLTPGTDPRIQDAQQMQAVTFALAYITKECWEKTGGFQEPETDSFEYFYEDVDFCLTAKEKGFEVWYHPLVRAWHVGAASSQEVFKDKTKEESDAFFYKYVNRIAEKWGDKIIVDKAEKEKMPPRKSIMIAVPILEEYDYCLDLFLKSLCNLDYWHNDISLFFIVNNSGKKFWTKLRDWGLLYGKEYGFHKVMLPNEMQYIGDKNKAVVYARNVAAYEALRLGYDYLYFVDCDVIVENKALQKLMDLDSDIAISSVVFQDDERKPMILKLQDRFSGLTPEWFEEQIKGINTGYELDNFCAANNFERLTGEFEFWPDINNERQPVEVAASGLGCALIKRNVLEALEKMGDIFEPHVKAYATEDLWFFHKARKAGFKTICDPSIKTYHLGEGMIYPSSVGE